MRTATNQAGFVVEVLTPEGWRKSGFGPAHDTRDQAQIVMAGRRISAPELEWRVMPELEVRP